MNNGKRYIVPPSTPSQYVYRDTVPVTMTEDDTNFLLYDEQQIEESPPKVATLLSPSTPPSSNETSRANGFQTVTVVPQSCSIQETHHSAEYQEAGTYGSLPPTFIRNPSQRRIFYCVHGKTDCCMVSQGQVLERDHPNLPPRDSNEVHNQIAFAEEHCHRGRNEAVDNHAKKKLITASILCIIFMVGEVIGGYLSSSLAIATDAAHLLTDFVSFMISLFSLWVASRPPTRTMSFGWYRAEVIGALTSVLMIWIITGVLIYMAIERIITEDFDIDATIMLITSALGVVVNLVMGLTLHQPGHSHGKHIHEQADTQLGGSSSLENSGEQRNINVRAAFIHVIGDFIQSIGVFIAALIIYFQPTWIIVDPICTFLFSALVLMTTFAIVKDALRVLMEGTPKGIDFKTVMDTFLNIDGVIKVHNLRLWALSLDKKALSAHLAIKQGASPQQILREATRNIHARYNFFEMTLQIEEFVEDMEDCVQCRCPDT